MGPPPQKKNFFWNPSKKRKFPEKKNCTGAFIRIGREIQCLPYAICFMAVKKKEKKGGGQKKI